MQQRPAGDTSEQSEALDSEQRWSALLVRAQQGDEDAYRSLLTEWSDVIRRYLTRRLGRRDLIDDCVQECLISIHQAKHTYDPARPVRPWFFAIVRYRTIDVLRRNPQHTISEESTMNPEHRDRVEAEVDSATLLDSLSDSLREPLYLTRFVGLSNRECAEALGISEGAVKVKVFRALQRLKKDWGWTAP